MAYSDKYDVPIVSIAYNNLGSDPRDFSMEVQFLDGTKQTFITVKEIASIHRQLADQDVAIRKGEVLRVVQSRVPESTDGQVWAQEFIRIVINRDYLQDEALLTSWFANAIESGRDAGFKAAQLQATSDTFGYGLRGGPYVLG